MSAVTAIVDTDSVESRSPRSTLAPSHGDSCVNAMRIVGVRASVHSVEATVKESM